MSSGKYIYYLTSRIRHCRMICNFPPLRNIITWEKALWPLKRRAYRTRQPRGITIQR
jgi:hypothetical protein